MGNEDNGRRRKRLIVVCVCIAILLLCAIAYFFYYQNAITAVTMRIQRLVGTVNLYNEEGSEQSLREKMRLGAGQTIKTAGESLIMVSLDDTKLMTMEESSRANIRAKGKHLEFDLLEGNLFFNVTEKLGDNESFDINTTTMVCGIRGTSAYIGKDATGHEVLMVTDGIVHVLATNPVTLEFIEEDVDAGQMRTVYLDDEAEGNATISFGKRVFKEEDLPAMALDTMRKNPELLDRVAKATGFSTKKITTLADLTCTKGVSMYGTAAGELAAEGIEDAIPYMGERSEQMTSSANSALGIAEDDLPLEVALIEGYRDMLDTAVENGYSDDDVDLIMDGTRDCVEEVFESVDEAELSKVDRLSTAISVTDSVWVAGMRMADAKKLLASEIVQVTDTVATLYTGAIDEAVRTSDPQTKSSNVQAAVGRISNHVTSVVTAEMVKNSNGEETVIALLAGGSTAKPVANKQNTDDTKKIIAEAKASAKIPELGDTSGQGATPSEIRSASSAVVATDPNTGIMALADGTFFDPVYYAAANPDVVKDYGTDPNALLSHWLKKGKDEGRPPIAPVTLTPTATPVPEWLWKQWDQEKNNSSEDPYSDEEEEEEPEPTSTPTPTQAAIPQAATTCTLSGNDIINSNGTKIGELSGSRFKGVAYNQGTGNLSWIDMPINVIEQTSSGTTLLYRFTDLRDVDWAASQQDAMIRDTNLNGGAYAFVTSSTEVQYDSLDPNMQYHYNSTSFTSFKTVVLPTWYP